MDHTLLKAYVDQGLSQRDIADQMGVSQTTIRYWLKKFSLKTFPKRHTHCGCGIELTSKTAYTQSDGRLYYWCKRCLNRYTNDRQKRNKERAIIQKGGKCERCGYSKSVAALEFHHRDRTEKGQGIAKMMLRKWNDILAEIEKCDLLCSNCHREVEEEIQASIVLAASTQGFQP